MVSRPARKKLKAQHKASRLGTGIYSSSKHRRAEREYYDSQCGPVTVRRIEDENTENQ